MKGIIILLSTITLVVANVCENEDQAVGSPLSGSFEISGAANSFLNDILEDQHKNLLYFVGHYYTGTSPNVTIIYKADHNLSKLKVMTYEFIYLYPALTISPKGDFIYAMDRATDSILEISTNTLSITRQLSIGPATADHRWDIKMTTNLYFNIGVSSKTEEWIWDTTSANVDWLNLGSLLYSSLAPIGDDQIFVAWHDAGGDQYYLANYNFSDTFSLVWHKSIACPSTGWVGNYSSSIYSENEKAIYTIVLYDSNFIIHKLNDADGSPANSGLIWNDSGLYNTYSMKEFSEFIAIQITTATLVNK